MKASLLSIALILSRVVALGQNQALIGNSYIFISDNVVVYGYDSEDDQLNQDIKFLARLNTKFRVDRLDVDNNLVISFWDYPVKNSQKGSRAVGHSTDYSVALEFIGNWANDKLFVIKTQDFNNTAKPFYGPKGSFNWGVMTLPIKVRPGKGDRDFTLEENLNLGFFAGYKQQIGGTAKKALNFLGGASITRVRIEENSLKDAFPIPEGSTASGLMLSAGIVY